MGTIDQSGIYVESPAHFRGTHLTPPSGQRMSCSARSESACVNGHCWLQCLLRVVACMHMPSGVHCTWGRMWHLCFLIAHLVTRASLPPRNLLVLLRDFAMQF